MKVTTRLMLIACLALPLLVACKPGEEKQEVGVNAPLAAPTTSDDNAWGAYLSDVVTRNMEGVTSNPYLYYLPAEDSPDFEGSYERLQGEVDVAMQRGILEGNLVAFGSPASAKMADIIVFAFATVDPGSMKGVKLLFIGDSADSDRVQAAVTPAGVDYKFIEAK